VRELCSDFWFGLVFPGPVFFLQSVFPLFGWLLVIWSCFLGQVFGLVLRFSFQLRNCFYLSEAGAPWTLSCCVCVKARQISAFHFLARLIRSSDFVRKHARGWTCLPCWSLVCTSPFGCVPAVRTRQWQPSEFSAGAFEFRFVFFRCLCVVCCR
jgi:hypothetical protein